MKTLLIPIALALFVSAPVMADKPDGKGKTVDKELKQIEKQREKELKQLDKEQKHAEKMHEKELKRAEKEAEHAKKMHEKELKHAEKDYKNKADKTKSEEDMKELEHISEKGLEQRRKWWQLW